MAHILGHTTTKSLLMPTLSSPMLTVQRELRQRRNSTRLRLWCSALTLSHSWLNITARLGKTATTAQVRVLYSVLTSLQVLCRCLLWKKFTYGFIGIATTPSSCSQKARWTAHRAKYGCLTSMWLTLSRLVQPSTVRTMVKLSMQLKRHAQAMT